MTPLEIELMIFQLVAQCLKVLLSFKKALFLSLSMNVFPAYPAPDLTLGNLCRYVEGRLRSCKWKSGVLLG